jgi:hypothetical protein
VIVIGCCFGIIRKLMRPAVFGVFRERLGGARPGELWKAIEGFLFFATEASVSTMCQSREWEARYGRTEFVRGLRGTLCVPNSET